MRQASQELLATSPPSGREPSPLNRPKWRLNGYRFSTRIPPAQPADDVPRVSRRGRDLGTDTRRHRGDLLGSEDTEDVEKKIVERQRRFRHLLNGVYLFGTEPVRRQAAADLQAVNFDITADWWARLREKRRRGQNVTPGDVAPSERMHEWEAALERLITAMREDVAQAR